MEFSGSTSFVALCIDVTYETSEATDMHVQSITWDPLEVGTDNTPTTPQTINGTGVVSFPAPVASAGAIIGVRLEWDTPGAVLSACINCYDNQ